MQGRAFVVLAMALGLAVVVGCKPKEQAEAEKQAAKADLEKMQGKWKVVTRQEAVEDAELGDVAEFEAPGTVVLIKGDVMEFTYKGDVEYRQKISLVPGKDPKQVDLTDVDADGKPIQVTTTKKSGLSGKKKKTKTTFKDVGIYSLEGDTLKFCMSFDEKKRPTDFSAPPKSARYLLTLQRIQAESPISVTQPPGTAASRRGTGK